MFTLLGAIFAIGATGFWILVAVVTCVLLALIENEKPVWATLMMGVTLIFLHAVGSLNLPLLIVEHPWGLAASVGGYFLAGTAWAITKWWFYVKASRKKYDEIRTLFLKSHGVWENDIPDRLLGKWHEQIDHYHDYQRYDRKSANAVIPRVRDHKGRIMLWMCYWPWSAVWTLINDPIKRLFQAIYRQIHGLLQSISDRAFKGVDTDFRKPLTPPADAPAIPEESTNVPLRARDIK